MFEVRRKTLRIVRRLVLKAVSSSQEASFEKFRALRAFRVRCGDDLGNAGVGVLIFPPGSRCGRTPFLLLGLRACSCFRSGFRRTVCRLALIIIYAGHAEPMDARFGHGALLFSHRRLRRNQACALSSFACNAATDPFFQRRSRLRKFACFL